MIRESKSKVPSRLQAYTQIGKQASAIGAFGIAAGAVTGTADAALQTWDVNALFGYNNHAGTSGADLALSATFNTAFKVNFFNNGTVNEPNQEHNRQPIWAPNDNLSFINRGHVFGHPLDDPALWSGALSFGADANDGIASALTTYHGGEHTNHSWYKAKGNHNSAHACNVAYHDTYYDPHKGTFAIGIRFDAGAGNYHYGWVEVSNDNVLGAFSVERWAVETTANTAASYAPAVPGPMGLTALALGAAGVRRSRKRSA